MSKYILIFCISIVAHFDIYGSHIIGGDVFYQCVLVDTVNQTATLNVEFQLFRDGRFNPDPNAAKSFDSMALFGIYRMNSGRWEWVETVGPMLISIPEEPVPVNDLECLVSGPALMMIRGVYRFQVTLDLIDDDYMIAYQRCCRGVGVSNLVGAAQEGSVFEIQITPEGLRSCNDPIKYRQFPPSVLCAGFPFRFDHSVADLEGDSVIYELCTPLSSGRFLPDEQVRDECDRVAPNPRGCLPDDFREVRFDPSFFSEDAPIAGDPVMTIDRFTGLISGTPNVLGELVMAVCATEYRDGVVLSRIKRDMQFVITLCERDLVATVASDNILANGSFEVLACGDEDVQFISTSTNEAYIYEYDWRFDTGNGIVRSDEKDPLIEFPGLGVYDAKLVLNPGAFICTDSADIVVKLFPDIIADYDFSLDTCEAGPVTFTDLSSTEADDIVAWNWDYGDGGLSRQQDPQYTFRTPGLKDVILTVTDNNGCRDSTIMDILYTPLPEQLAILPNFFITCTPGIITFDNISEPIDSTYDVLWDFGDGTTGPESMELNPTHTYEEAGTYTIKLSVTSPTGCTAIQTFNDFVEIRNGFNIDFEFTPERPTLLQNKVDFTGTSEVAGEFIWFFGDGSTSTDQNPSHTYQDTGLYVVSLAVRDATGCIDTLSKEVYVAPIVELIYPNAFTPDGDDKNDLFLAKGISSLISDFELLIFDRWGKVVFKTTDPSEGWNGKLNNSGLLLPIGVYSYLSTYEVPRFGTIEKRGMATLIR